MKELVIQVQDIRQKKTNEGGVDIGTEHAEANAKHIDEIGEVDEREDEPAGEPIAIVQHSLIVVYILNIVQQKFIFASIASNKSCSSDSIRKTNHKWCISGLLQSNQLIFRSNVDFS